MFEQRVSLRFDVMETKIFAEKWNGTIISNRHRGTFAIGIKGEHSCPRAWFGSNLGVPVEREAHCVLERRSNREKDLMQLLRGLWFYLILSSHYSQSRSPYYVILPLASKSISPKTVEVYLASIWHMQIMLGLPELQEFSSLPRLHLVQVGTQSESTRPRKTLSSINPINFAADERFMAERAQQKSDAVVSNFLVFS